MHSLNTKKLMQEKQTDIYIEAVVDDCTLEVIECLKRWTEEGNSILRQHKHYACTKRELKQFMIARFLGQLNIQLLEIADGHWVVRGDHYLIKTGIRSGAVQVEAIGCDIKRVDECIHIFDAAFSQAATFIHWLYSEKGSTIEVPMSTERLPIDEMYPFLNGESLEDYYSRFIDSSASILLLIGPPGTGKTSFIRGLIDYSQMDALVCYDANLLERDMVFTHFVDEEDLGLMILEDADNFLRPRNDGNTMMHRFLNIGDGLVTLARKKMVFSTNLPSVADIDPALTRPGRCFDILSFNHLNNEQARIVAEKLGTQLPSTQEDFSIAEIFHAKTNGMNSAAVKGKMGFI